jgi:hypothetical protein
MSYPYCHGYEVKDKALGLLGVRIAVQDLEERPSRHTRASATSHKPNTRRSSRNNFLKALLSFSSIQPAR